MPGNHPAKKALIGCAWAFGFLVVGGMLGHLLGVAVETLLGLPDAGDGPWPGVLGAFAGGLGLLYKGLSLAGEDTEGWREALALHKPLRWWPVLLLPATGHLSERILRAVRELSPALDMGAISSMEAELQAWGPHSFFFLLSVIIVAPLGEEVLFRGVLYRGLARSWGQGIAVVTSACLFCIWHVDPAHVLAVFVIGLWLSWIRAVTGSIWPCVLAHVLNNGVWVLGTLTMPLGLPVGMGWDLGCGTLLVAAAWGLRGACDWKRVV